MTTTELQRQKQITEWLVKLSEYKKIAQLQLSYFYY